MFGGLNDSFIPSRICILAFTLLRSMGACIASSSASVFTAIRVHFYLSLFISVLMHLNMETLHFVASLLKHPGGPSFVLWSSSCL